MQHSSVRPGRFPAASGSLPAAHMVRLVLCGFVVVASLVSATVQAAPPSQFTWVGPQQASIYNSSTICAPIVLQQQNCGSCWAFSATTTIAMSICAQLQTAGLASSTDAQQFLQLSPQMLMNLLVYGEQTTLLANKKPVVIRNPCDGFNPEILIEVVQLIFNNISHQNINLSTCSTSSAGPCSAGCMPYTEANCVASTNLNNVMLSEQYIDEDYTYMCDSSAGTCECQAFTPATGCSNNPSAAAGPATGVLALPPHVWFEVSPHFHPDLTTTAGIEWTQEWLMTNGPLSVGMAGAASDDFVNYFKNQLSNGPTAAFSPSNNECNGRPDHAVVLVGWVLINNQPCWMIQNSWGPSEGDGGFFYVAFETVGQGNQQMNILVKAGVQLYNTVTNFPLTKPPPMPQVVSGATQAPAATSATAAPASTTLTAADSAAGTSMFDTEMQASNPKDYVGSIQPLPSNTSRHGHVIKGYMQILTQRSNVSVHRFVALQSVSQQVVQGVIYHVSAYVSNIHTNEIRISHTVLKPTNYVATNTSQWILVRHRIQVPTAQDMAAMPPGLASSDSNSASGSSSHVALGLGLGVGLTALVTLAAYAVVRTSRRRHAAVVTAAPNTLEEKLLDERSLLPTTSGDHTDLGDQEPQSV